MKKFIDIVRMHTFHRETSFVEIFYGHCSKDTFHVHCRVKRTITMLRNPLDEQELF